MTWNPDTLPDARGRTYAVTGATAGIGYFAAEQVAAAGARVVLLSRSATKLETARAAILGEVPGADLVTVPLELGSLASVADAAAALSELDRLDGILLNGGAMNLRSGQRTGDGLPLMIGTHHVANAGLVAGALPALAASARRSGVTARIVHTSTGFVRQFPQRVDDLLVESRIGVRAYTQAKTATEIFAFELQRRLQDAGLPVESLVVKPGVGVDAKTPQRPGIRDASIRVQRNPYTPWAQGKDTAAWSAVRALLDPEARGGEYYGPAGRLRGLPVAVEPEARTARPDPELADRIWRQTEQLLGRPLITGA